MIITPNCISVGAAVVWRWPGQRSTRHFVLARDFDTLRFRADTKLNDLIRAAAAGRTGGNTVCRFGKGAGAGESQRYSWEEFLYEHVHLNFSGNYRLGLAIAKQVFDALPQKLKEGPTLRRVGSQKTECGGRLAWTGWDRCRTTKSVLLSSTSRRLRHNATTRSATNVCGSNSKSFYRTETGRAAPGVTEYRQALSFSPQDWVLQRNLAHLQRNIGDPAGAEVSMRKAVALLPHDPMGHLELGLLLVQSDRAEEAIAEFEVILRSNPGSIAALNGLALALSQLGRQSEAINKLETALKLKPHSADTQLNLGTTLDAVGRKEEAEEHLRQAVIKNWTRQNFS
jgi:tetratricopeptide (TPR) repeat protein